MDPADTGRRFGGTETSALGSGEQRTPTPGNVAASAAGKGRADGRENGCVFAHQHAAISVDAKRPRDYGSVLRKCEARRLEEASFLDPGLSRPVKPSDDSLR